MAEFSFDIKLAASVRVDAVSEPEARALLACYIRDTDCISYEGLIFGEATLFGTPQLYEIDGEPV